VSSKSKRRRWKNWGPGYKPGPFHKQQREAPVFNPKPYRDRAANYAERSKTATTSNETYDFEQKQKSFTVLADNEQWLADNHQKTIRAPGAGKLDAGGLAQEEEHVLRCLGAALIMQWNTLPTKLQRELFDNAGSMGELLDIAALRGQIARFLHKHKDENSGV
jgi:hypothetical protein